MKYKIAKICIILVLFTKCSNQNIKYTLYFDSDDILTGIYQGDFIKSAQGQTVESDSVLIYLNKDLFSSGKFNKGLKTGNWNYMINDKRFNINWDYGGIKGESMFINFPINWEFSKLEGFDIALNTTLVKNKYTNDYLTIRSFAIDSLEHLQFKLFYYQLFQDFESKYKIIKINASYEFKNEDNLFYYQEVDAEIKSERVSMYTVAFEYESKYYVCNYSFTNDKDKLKNRIIFSDIIKSIRVDGKRCYNPLEKTKIVKKSGFFIERN